MRQLLAQRIVDEIDPDWHKRPSAKMRHDTLLKTVMAECLDSLRRPWDGANHSVLPHRALGPIYAAEAERASAAIYHFDAHAFAAALAIGRSNRRKDLVYANARAPVPRCFFEWQHPDEPENTHGIYVSGDRSKYHFLRWLEDAGRPVPLHFGYYSIDDRRGYVKIVDGPWDVSERERNLLERESSWMVIYLWALLATSGATVINRTPAPRGSSKQAHRKSPGAAILSFNRVRLALPKGLSVRNEVVQWERGPGVRRHQVTGHPAWYHVGPQHEGAMLLRWIAAYWRGNARLGLVLKAQDVGFDEGRRA